MVAKPKYKITKEQQLQELVSRIPPLVNVDVVIVRDGKYLMGRRNKKIHPEGYLVGWLFPGGRMKYTETPQETATRILKTEAPGVKAIIKKFITALPDCGYDYRANGITLYYLCEYISGTPKPNTQLDQFKWVDQKSVSKLPRVYQLQVNIFNEIDKAVREMNSNMDELLVEVNSKDKEIGTIDKRLAHSTNKRYHRAAHIMIFDSKGRVVLQQRSLVKVSHPGFWDMPGGHQAAGQTIEQTAAAELSEEMGISIPLTLKRIGLNKTKDQAEFYYLYYGVSDGPYGFDRNEVEQINIFDCSKLLKDGYDSNYPILAHVKRYTRELRYIWEPLTK